MLLQISTYTEYIAACTLCSLLVLF
uniref:Uncharacterized protein n=1 Tax=Arundo donax TaxID=35708 RepID=A0A0A9AD25_ARUDO